MNTRPKLLLIEDNPDFNRQLAQLLKTDYHVTQVTTLTGAFNHVAENSAGYEVVLLDRGLPDGDGLDLVPLLTQNFPHTKICILSGQVTPNSHIEGLEKGADLCISKPISARYLTAHLRALMRRGKIATDTTVLFQDLHFAETTRTVVRQSQKARLSERESQCLKTLIRSSDGRATREELFTLFWQNGLEASASLLHVNIQRLRQKLAPLKVRIESIYGFGYQLVLE